MPPVVMVERALLRQGSLDVLLDLVKPVDGAVSLVERPPSWVRSARRNDARVRAVGDLLDAIGWTARDISVGYRLDVGVHGWAAASALSRLIERQRAVMQMADSEDEAEAVGEAGAALLDAERDLALIEQACREANLTIASPAPAAVDREFGERE